MPNDPAQDEQWQGFLGHLRLADPDDYAARVREVAGYVTLVDELVEGWAAGNGV
jgi:hypothetical protein